MEIIILLLTVVLGFGVPQVVMTKGSWVMETPSVWRLPS